VSNNIKSFRGNHRKVTIFGESSGSISVDALLTVPPAKPQFHAAIMQSGTVLSNSLASLGADPNNTWTKTLSEFNCSDAADAVACLRAVPVASLKEFANNNTLATAVVSDNRTYTPRSALQRTSGAAAKVPLLIGTTANDGTIFVIGQTNLSAFISTTFAPLPDLQKQLAEAYKVGSPGIPTESAAIAQIFTEVGLQCPTELLARQIQNTSVPVWRYIYNATFPNLSPAEGLGAFHSSEIPMVFSTYNVSTANAQQYALSDYMRGAWASFAKNPKKGPGWGAVGLFDGTDLGILGLDGSSGVTVVGPAEAGIDERCGLYESLYGLLS
jgi:acetylcholinesterase